MEGLNPNTGTSINEYMLPAETGGTELPQIFVKYHGTQYLITESSLPVCLTSLIYLKRKLSIGVKQMLREDKINTFGLKAKVSSVVRSEAYI